MQLSLDKAVEERGILLHPDDPAWRELELAFIKAQRSALDSIQARLKGETVVTPELPDKVSRQRRLATLCRAHHTAGSKVAARPPAGRGRTRLRKRSVLFSASSSCMVI